MTEEQTLAFLKFKNKLINACAADAKLEYLDKGERAAREAWDEASKAEREFRRLLEETPNG
jgi:hypothetical protein